MVVNRLTVIRHAPTESNGARVFMGGKDIAATAQGLEEAAARADGLRDAGYAPVFASPLQRALSTAHALFPTSTVAADPRLAERSLGEWEGQPHDLVRERHPRAFSRGGVLDPRFTPPGGEDLDTFLRRIRSFLRDAGEASRNGSPVAVSHNGWIRTAQYLTGHLEAEEIFVEGVPFLQPIELDLRPLLAGRL